MGVELVDVFAVQECLQAVRERRLGGAIRRRSGLDVAQGGDLAAIVAAGFESLNKPLRVHQSNLGGSLAAMRTTAKHMLADDCALVAIGSVSAVTAG
jgi:hypothetical protein